MDPVPTTDQILHFQTLILLRIYDTQMHILQCHDKKLAEHLEKVHQEDGFGVEVD